MGAAEGSDGRPVSEIDPALPDYPTLVHALAFAARQAPDRAALVCEDYSLTFVQYRRAVGGLARYLRQHGAQGGRVAIMMANSVEMAVACLGAMAAGAQTAPVNPGYSERELTPLLTDSDPAIMLCDAAFADKARALAARFGIAHVAILGAGGIDIGDWADDEGLDLPQPLPSADDAAAMFFTGGTTGVPKGAEHIHAMMILFCRQMATVWRLEMDTERILSVAPMFHIWGHHVALVMPLYLRATLVTVRQYQPETVLEQFERHAITVFAGGPPAIYLGLLGHPKVASTDFSSLKYCMGGGAPCSEDLLRQWERTAGCEVLEGLGMSEGAPISGNPTHGERKLMSVGIIPPLTEIDIVDIETGTKVLAPLERGEIRVRGPQFTRGYRNRPDETAAAIRDGWLHTGDIGYLDDDGFLFLVDRKKELILVGGFNVYPREIDEVLYSHEAVHEAAAVGIADDFKGEVVKAFVALVPGADIGEPELIEYCAARLIDYKVPVAIDVMAALPKTGANKIDKLALRGLKR